MTPPRPRRGRSLSAEDQLLWDQVAATVKPRVRRKQLVKPPAIPATATPPPAPKPPAKLTPARKPAVIKPQGRPEPTVRIVPAPPAQPSGLDGKREDRFRKGKIEIEARIDLHGLTLDLAHGALGGFLLQARARGQRCVLVITGKGNPTGEGAIKRLTPRWLSEAPYTGMIASIATAQPRHGGSGALYVYLRRKRT